MIVQLLKLYITSDLSDFCMTLTRFYFLVLITCKCHQVYQTLIKTILCKVQYWKHWKMVKFDIYKVSHKWLKTYLLIDTKTIETRFYVYTSCYDVLTLLFMWFELIRYIIGLIDKSNYYGVHMVAYPKPIEFWRVIIRAQNYSGIAIFYWIKIYPNLVLTILNM